MGRKRGTSAYEPERDEGADERSDEGGGERPTRAERRRHGERSALLARKLLSLPDAELEHLTLPDAVVEELEEARRIRSQGALRRQERRLAQVLRDDDLEAVEAVLEARQRERAEQAQRFQRVEHWRERLLSSAEAEAELLHVAPDIPAAELHALVEAARQERDRGRPKGAGRVLFRRLREWLEGEA